MEEQPKQQQVQIAAIQMVPGNDGNGVIVRFNILGAFEQAIVVSEEVLSQFLKERLKAKQEQQRFMELLSKKGVKNVG